MPAIIHNYQVGARTAIVGGGKGAAIGAAVGAGAGAGAVYVQGREDLDLMSGAEFTIRASAHR
jgi:outer membrane lipoprotein SlyB